LVKSSENFAFSVRACRKVLEALRYWQIIERIMYADCHNPGTAQRLIEAVATYMNTCVAQISAVIANPWLTTHTTLHPPLSIASLNPVSAMKPTVARNLFAFHRNIHLLNCASIPSNTLSKLNQKKLRRSTPHLLSFATACVDLVHEFTCAFRKEPSLSSLGGM